MKGTIASWKRSASFRKQTSIVECLFDREWYLSQNADVAKVGADAIEHYLRHGSAEGRWPNPVFDPSWYKAQNADLTGWPLDPLCHFVQHGRFEGRWPGPDFDPPGYLRLHSDVAAAQYDATEHYVRYGRREGRVTTAELPHQANIGQEIETVDAPLSPPIFSYAVESYSIQPDDQGNYILRATIQAFSRIDANRWSQDRFQVSG